jgi:uncharacterized protein (DUF362 family)/NAD-dependent dihydropyrimidine dehydrogenase PreA subunit
VKQANDVATVACVRAAGVEEIPQRVTDLLALLGGLEQFVKPGDTVFLKPNFVAPFPQAVTHFDFIAGVVRAVQACGGKAIIGESSGFEFDTEKTLQVVGAHDLAQSLGVPLLNLDREPFRSVPGEWPFGEMRMAQIVYDADVFINLPKLKRHSLTTMTGALKNLFGVLHRDTRRRMHAWNVNKGIVAVNRVLRPTLSLVEGVVTLTRAVYGQAELLGVLLGGAEPLALDRVGCQLLGLSEAEVPHISGAVQAGLMADYQLVGADLPAVETSTRSGSLGRRLHRALIQGAYVADIPYAAVRPGRSILPRLHFELGLKPHIKAEACTECGDCVPVCPVDAIDIPARRILPERCECLRCLKCVAACPENAIEVVGWRRPSKA